MSENMLTIQKTDIIQSKINQIFIESCAKFWPQISHQSYYITSKRLQSVMYYFNIFLGS